MIPDSFNEVGVRVELLATGWSAVAVFILAALIIIVGERMQADEGHLFVGGTFVAIGLFVAGAWAVLMWPYSGEYHHVYRVEGEVVSVSNVLTEASGDLTRTPVIELDTVDRSITIDDPRAVNLEGERVSLTCRINWRYQAADRYDCDIYEAAR